MKVNSLILTYAKYLEDLLGITYYKEQLEAVQYLKDGYMCEIATGEGKTYILLLYCYLLFKTTNDNILLISSSEDLANRELELYKIIFHEDVDKSFKAKKRVVILDTSTAVFAYIANEYGPSTYTVIVDEFDNAAIDCADNGFSVSFLRPTETSIPVRIKQLDIFFRTLSVNIDLSVEPEDKEILDAIAMCDVIIYPVLNQITLTDKFFKKYSKFFSSNPTELTRTIIDAYCSAKYLLRLGKDYVISNNLITPIDASGYTHESSRLDLVTQNVLEYFNKLEFTKSNGRTYSLNFLVFLSLFKSITGVSGTLAEVAKEIESIFQKPVKVCKRHFISNISMHDKIMLTSTVEKYKFVLNLLKTIEYDKVLILCYTDEELQEMKKYIDIAETYYSSTSSGISEEINNYSIICATMVAGRGVNIKSSNLLVIVADTLPNNRILRQFLGRTARNGNSGTAYIVQSIQDIVFKSLGNEVSFSNYQKLLDKQQLKLEDNRKYNMFVGKMIEGTRVYLYNRFCDIDKKLLEHHFFDLQDDIKNTFISNNVNINAANNVNLTKALLQSSELINSFISFIQKEVKNNG